jgi:hypothetical protein
MARRARANRRCRPARRKGRVGLYMEALEARLLLSAVPSVVGRYVYYGSTPRWGDVAAGNKSVLLPGETASFSNITTYTCGINEVVLDVANAAAYGPGDFTARVGRSGDPNAWPQAAPPQNVTCLAGAGVGGSTRVFVRWADGTLCDTWVQVTFTPALDTFYVGNLTGATNGLTVTASDEEAVRENFSSFLTPITPANAYDFNRDGKVDTIDELITRAAAGHALPEFGAPDNSSSNPAGPAAVSVAGRYVYYGQTPRQGDFWASDKTVLLPSQTATFANVTSYVEGINELVLDVVNGTGSYSGSDFVFRVGQLETTQDWALAPLPTSVTTVAGGGAGGSSRVTVRWASGSIVNEWLQVNFRPAGDTFYVGNLVGATNALTVTAEDEEAVRSRFSWLGAEEPGTSAWDFNHDGKVDAIDALIARDCSGQALAAITAPGSVAGRYIYYGNTPYYGDVWAADKKALPAYGAGWGVEIGNVSSFAGGINEIVIDMTNGRDTYGTGDFVFRTGAGGDPAGWEAAPMPLSISTAPGKGINGSSRVFVRWAEGAIKDQWLEVTVVPAGDTFYVGSLVGALNGLAVTAEVEGEVRAHFSSLLSPEPVTSVYDFNRDGKVDAIDALIARDCYANALDEPVPADADANLWPATPTNLQAAVIGPFEVQLTWTDAAQNETGFRIERQLAGSGTWTQVAVVGQDSTAYIDRTALPHRTYEYRVSAFNDGWSSGGSNRAEGTTPASVTRDAEGWTQIAPAPETQIIYVSSSAGNDANDGSSPGQAVNTLTRAEDLFTTGHPVWMLLKAGDSWNEAVGGWGWPGLDADRPSLISSYGTGARPVLKTGSEAGILLFGGGGAPATLNFIDIIGLDFYANERDPDSPDFAAGTSLPSGIAAARGGTGILVEGCRLRFYGVGINVSGMDGPWSDVTIRRNVVVNSYGADETMYSQGMYVSETNGLVIEENILDHNGWSSSPLLPEAVATIFNHNLYLQSTNSNVVVRDNIIAHASSHGLQARSGGTITGNLFVHNPISILIGANASNEPQAGMVTDNVILDGSDIMWTATLIRGWGIDINYLPTLQVTGNVIAKNLTAGPSVIVNDGTANTIVNNVMYSWGEVIDHTNLATVGSGQIDPTNLADPTRSVGSYMASLGRTATLDAFLAAAEAQYKGNWNTAFMAAAVNAYIRAGFVTTAPTGVSALPAGSGAVNISWDATSGVVHYVIERSLDGSTGWVQVAAPMAGVVSYRDTLLISGTRYYYRVKAVNGIGPSAVSLTVDALAV